MLPMSFTTVGRTNTWPLVCPKSPCRNRAVLETRLAPWGSIFGFSCWRRQNGQFFLVLYRRLLRQTFFRLTFVGEVCCKPFCPCRPWPLCHPKKIPGPKGPSSLCVIDVDGSQVFSVNVHAFTAEEPFIRNGKAIEENVSCRGVPRSLPLCVNSVTI